MSDIPTDLHHEILRRLPADSLLRFRAVCKWWRRLIDEPSFVRTHAANQTSSTTLLIRNSTATRFCSLNLDSLNFDDAHQVIDVMPVKALFRVGLPRSPVLPVACCNGLILHSQYENEKTWVIWNTLTREFHELPQFNTEFDDADSCFRGGGIGYDSASDDYKVVRIDSLDYDSDSRTVYQTSFYSLKMDSWTMTKDCPYDFSWMRQLTGVFLDGALHWILRNMIVAVVLETEDYRELPLPANSAELSDVHLDVLDGCLVVSCFYPMDRLDGWVMKDCGVEKSWVKLFSFREVGDIVGVIWCLRPIAYIKSKGHVFLQHGDAFFRLDVESNSLKKVIVRGLPRKFSSQIMVESLLRLDQSCAVMVKNRAGMKRKRNTADARVKHSVSIVDVCSSEGDD
ncbi:hypothetical protein ABFS83_10G123400 [Erythranthe nasuta]